MKREKKILKNTTFSRVSHHNALFFFFCKENIVSIYFLQFFYGFFLFENIKDKMNIKKSIFPGFPGTNDMQCKMTSQNNNQNVKNVTIEQFEHVFNTDPKSRSPTKYFCEPCEFTCKRKCDWDEHVITRKHQSRSNPEKDLQKTFTCEACNFNCTKLSKWNAHIETQRHKKQTNNNNEIKICCQYCGLIYTSRSGLWYHQQKCQAKKDNIDNQYEDENDDNEDKSIKPQQNNGMTPELMMMLLQQNKELQQAVIEIVKKIGNTTTNSHNTTNNIQNNNNKSFNLNFFLNETCKDAMNMSDFLNRLDVTTYDFEHTGKNGYVEGMCRILENGLNNLEVHERPIHCTDAKRETIYIKDNDKWEKDDEQKTKLTSVIKQVGAKNIKMIPQWCKEHPGWNDGDSKENDRYLKYVFNSMCGGTDEEICKNYGDIARYISKITVVDKNQGLAVPEPLA